MSFDPQVIRDSFEKAKPIAGQVADKFYEILWRDYPESKPLFASADMNKQKKALIGALVYIVNHIEDGDKLEKYLFDMGVRHHQYDTEMVHFEWVGESLLKTFAHFFGDDWTEELETHWAHAYNAIAGAMQSGLKHTKDQEVPLKDLADELARKLFTEALNNQAEAYLKELAEQKAIQLLRQSLKEVAASQLKKAS